MADAGENKGLEIKALAKGLKISGVQVWKLMQRGMPTGSLAEARAWRAENVETKTGAATRETTKLRGAQARIADFQWRKMAGELVEVSSVEASITEALVFIRSEVEGKAGRLAHQLAAMKDPAEIRQFLLHELRASLATAADRLEGWARMVAGDQASAAETDPVAGEVGRGKPPIPEGERGTGAIPQ